MTSEDLLAAFVAGGEWVDKHGLPMCGDPLYSTEFKKAFDAWLAERRRVSPMSDDTAVWWHGCWLEAGHFLWSRSGHHADRSPLEALNLDGGYAPREHRGTGKIIQTAAYTDSDRRREAHYASDELPQGRFLRTLVKLHDEIYTIISWWDHRRGARNSCFIARGEFSSEQMIEAFPRFFPKQAERLVQASVSLVEVKR